MVGIVLFLLFAVPERIVSLSSAATEILYYLGVEDRIVAVCDYSVYPPPAKEKLRVGRGFGNINMELITSLKPDLIICWEGEDERLLREKGFNLFVINLGGVESVMQMILDLSEVVGEKERGDSIVQEMRKKVEWVQEKLRGVKSKPKVYFEGYGGIGATRGPGSLTHNLIELAGGENIVGGLNKGFLRVSQEYIIMADPDVIIVEYRGADPEEIMSRPGWENITAVKTKRVYRQESYYTNYTPRCVEGLLQYAKWFHPEVFE